MDMVTSGAFSSRAAAIEALVDLGLSVGQVPNESLVELADLMERMSTLLEGHLQRLFFACLKDFIEKAEAVAEVTKQE